MKQDLKRVQRFLRLINDLAIATAFDRPAEIVSLVRSLTVRIGGGELEARCATDIADMLRYVADRMSVYLPAGRPPKG